MQEVYETDSMDGSNESLSKKQQVKENYNVEMYYDMMKESMSSVQSSNKKPKGILKKSNFKRSPIGSPNKLLHDLQNENPQEE